jgi:riboflavin kinase/FMN adenylyltransferase
MYLVRDYQQVPEPYRGAVVALGNFDGVHRGHRTVMEQAKKIAEADGAAAGVLTFEPHPRLVFTPDSPPFRLTPFRTKVRRLKALGLDLLVSLRFNKALFSKPAEQFVRDVLVDGLGVSHVVVGYDFVFGAKRSGDAALLQRLGDELGFAVTVMSPVTHGDDVCSSTIIRVNLETGRVRRAAELLGHWWEVEGRVRSGDQRGRTIGFPTLNLALMPQALRPSLGVYAVHVGFPKGDKTVWHKGVANIGNRPTFGGKSVLLEAHIFDFSELVYGHLTRVALVEHLRGEVKFDGLDALKAQITRDGMQARDILQRPENAVHFFHQGNGGH